MPTRLPGVPSTILCDASHRPADLDARVRIGGGGTPLTPDRSLEAAPIPLTTTDEIQPCSSWFLGARPEPGGPANACAICIHCVATGPSTTKAVSATFTRWVTTKQNSTASPRTAIDGVRRSPLPRAHRRANATKRTPARQERRVRGRRSCSAARARRCVRLVATRESPRAQLPTRRQYPAHVPTFP